LHLISKFASVKFLTFVEFVHRVCLNLEHWHIIQWCTSLLSYASCHQC